MNKTNDPKLKVLLTGASGGMGSVTLSRLLAYPEKIDLTVLALDTKTERRKMASFRKEKNLKIIWGDIRDAGTVRAAVKGCDLVLHIAAFVSPWADYFPQKAWAVNYGGTVNVINAIKACGQSGYTRLVYIGTVAETGDRMPPIHWGRVGDPIKPSMFDYYAVSKTAAERAVIESGLAHWVSLRQTGIIGRPMARIRDAIIFHNPFDNVLEYCSDRDSARAMEHLCLYLKEGSLPETFWNHIYNIGGGPSCRISTLDMYQQTYARIGLDDMDELMKPKEVALLNFHGQYYLDSDKLEDVLHFRSDPISYFYDCFVETMGMGGALAKGLCRVRSGRRMIVSAVRGQFRRLTAGSHGTVHFIKDHCEAQIEAYWGSLEKWEALPDAVSKMKRFTDWNTVVPLDHGYDESQPPEGLSLSDMALAAEFRGGKLISTNMKEGDWDTPLKFECAFGHRFKASPRLLLEGGHWCPECEKKSWNYGERARRDPFFAQVWDPLHDESEKREYPKLLFN